MSIPDFEVVTDEIVGFLTTDLTQVQEVLAYPPLELAGNSPVVSLHDDGVQPVDATWKRWWLNYKLTVSINLKASGAEAAETLLRQLRLAAMTSLEGNQQGTAYQYLGIKGTSPGFSTIADGTLYRYEEINFRVRVDCYQ